MPSDEEMVAFRLAPNDRKAIQRLIASGEFRNRSDFFRYAVKAALAAHGVAPRMPLDLDLEGVDLPTQEPARGAATRSSRGRRRTGVNL